MFHTWMSHLCACTMNDISFEEVTIEVKHMGQWNSIMLYTLVSLSPNSSMYKVTHVQTILYLLCVYTCTSITWSLQIWWLRLWYPVPFNRIFEIGINGKTWRVLKSWYEGGVGQMRLDGALSGEFEIKRGVKQDSVLPPTLFLLIMNLSSQQLEASGLGLVSMWVASYMSMTSWC